MIKNILDAVAIPSQAAHFPEAPELHAVYFDSIETDGPDLGPSRISAHNCTVELYAPSIKAGDEALHRLQAEMDSRGIRYTTQSWYWLKEIRRYQEVIEFTLIEKT